MAFGSALALGLPSSVFADSILLGSDYLQTLPGTFFNFGGPIGSVPLKGLPISPGSLGTTDTIVQRKADAVLPGVGSSATIPIELVQLSLVSVAPVTIGSLNWNVYVHLTPSTPNLGTMTITHTLPDVPGPAPEGTFDSFFDVFFTADFTEVGNPLDMFSVPGHTTLSSTGTFWGHDPVPGEFILSGPTGDPNANQHTGRPPSFSDMYISQSVIEMNSPPGSGMHIAGPAQVPEQASLLTLFIGLGSLAGLARWSLPRKK